jgi:D-alanine-D-alanine ligase-like ATP-grasp enzyme
MAQPTTQTNDKEQQIELTDANAPSVPTGLQGSARSGATIEQKRAATAAAIAAVANAAPGQRERVVMEAVAAASASAANASATKATEPKCVHHLSG